MYVKPKLNQMVPELYDESYRVDAFIGYMRRFAKTYLYFFHKYI